MDITSILRHTSQFIHHNNNDNNQYGVISRPLYVNISSAYKFDALILSLITRKVVNQLWQMISKPIGTCKFVLDAIIKLRQQKLYNNNNDMLLVHWICTLILYH